MRTVCRRLETHSKALGHDEFAGGGTGEEHGRVQPQHGDFLRVLGQGCTEEQFLQLHMGLSETEAERAR
jgi:hypothetical protein